MFTLHINPYFLKLNLPKSVLEDDNSSAKYDPSNGFLTVELTKEVPGEEFEDLDLLSKLLAPRSELRNEQHPKIEVIDSKDDDVALLVENTEKLSLEQEHEVFLEGTCRYQMTISPAEFSLQPQKMTGRFPRNSKRTCLPNWQQRVSAHMVS